MSRRLVAAVCLAILANPLNSSMIAVALVTIGEDFDVSLLSVGWLISAFYIASCVGQPLAGRLADLLGPRRVFCAGWVLVGLTGLAAPFAPAIGWLVAARVLTALGTSCAFPAGFAILRREAPGDSPPESVLGAVNVASSVSAALGPVLGGALVATTGWQGIFAVNAVLALVGLPLALATIPRDRALPVTVARIREVLDLPGIALFVVGLGGVLAWLISLSDAEPRWWALAAGAAGLVALAARERATRVPFLDLQVALDPRLLVIFAQYVAVNLVFYSAFFGVPQWLEEGRGFDPGTAGLLLLPVAGLGILVTPLAARLVRRNGPRPALLAGAVFLIAGSAALLGLSDATPVALIAAATALLGIPNGLNNLGLQSALYSAAPASSTGAAAGLFQTSRFLGAIAATALISLTLGSSATSAGLREMSLVLLAVSILILLATARSRSVGRA